MSTQGSVSSPNELLQMELQPSRLLLTFLILTHLLAMWAVVQADLHSMLRLGIIASLVSGGYCYSRRRAVSFLQMRSGRILLKLGDQLVPVKLESAPWCNEWLQVLRFKPLVDDCSLVGITGTMQGRRWRWQRRLSVVILPDSASAQSRRRLRVLLRWHGFASGVPV